MRSPRALRVAVADDEALVERRVHLGINTSVPAGFVGDALLTMRFIAAAHPDQQKGHVS